MDDHLLASVSQLIWEGFEEYLAEFREITNRAPQRFENRDWHAIQADSRERLNLYKKKVSRLARKARRLMAMEGQNREYWGAIRTDFEARSLRCFEFEIARTFFNSVCRKVFDNLGADKGFMFVEESAEQPEYESAEPIYRTYPANKSVKQLVKAILNDYEFQVPFENIEQDIANLTDSVTIDILFMYRPDADTRIEMLKRVFYRNKGAYLVGRVLISGQIIPIILPILHGKNGIYVDALITEPDDASIIFSFTRSHFMVDIQIPSEMVRFLSSIMPSKQPGDIYNAIGFSKHGKTAFYRSFLRHMDQSSDQFILAPGIKGLVMTVFTLDSYNVVFKLIKDKCDPPKQVTRGQVKAKYKLVSRHDRVGRMADTHEFLQFEFDKARFSTELLAELRRVVPSLMEEKGDKLILRHLYTERKMVPLNLYLKKATPVQVEEAIAEYGNTIKQLAAANIFPGDMLLKNFGVTRHKRVVFYDYDEIGLLTEYNFREMPKATSNEEIYAAVPWFVVHDKDVFPKEFEHFLIGIEGIQDIFFELHSDLFKVSFWKKMQALQQEGQIPNIYPYRRKQRFRNV